MGKKWRFQALISKSESSSSILKVENEEAGKALAAAVEKDLQALDADGKVKELCEKYADQGISYDLWVLPKSQA